MTRSAKTVSPTESLPAVGPESGASELPPARIEIYDLDPMVDCGRYAPKACVGDRVEVRATIVRDGHEVLGGAVQYKGPHATTWSEAPMETDGNDRWVGAFEADAPGRWSYRIEAWVDSIATFQWEVSRKVEAGQRDLSAELAEGAILLGRDGLTVEEALAAEPGQRHEPVQSQIVDIDVERTRARVGAWYELFPRSWGGFAGVERELPRFAELGFDVLYVPPIHPIGHTNRKGRNNITTVSPGDPGSPWAVGSEDGGHTAVDPALGTLADFERLIASANEYGIEIAIDLAIQFSPDHPWLKQHPDWFHRRPDGTLKYAENPPKRYQDIYNVNFDADDWRGLWAALLEVVLFWIDRGVRIFRVDNPHTKPLPFWAWLIGEVRARHIDVVFLSEAFTRPALMTGLAKVGFSQSYTYFTWKNTKAELYELMDQILEWKWFFRSNFFTNTPDILHAYLQHWGRPAFEARLVLATTLSPAYGIYSGFENCENVPIRNGSEEYRNSEKYELKRRRLKGPLLPLIKRLNEVRREEAALHRVDNLVFLETENEQLIAYAKDDVLVCVNLDPRTVQEGLVAVPPKLGLPRLFRVSDLLTGAVYDWGTRRNYVRLEPGKSHVLKVEPE